MKKIESIQALRAIAAFFVVSLHSQYLVLGYKDRGAQDAFLNSTTNLLTFGSIGVDIFFVISGIVITLTSWNLFSSPQNVWIFLKKRIIRIFPIYWFYLFIKIFLIVFFSQFMTFKPVINIEKIISSIILIPHYEAGITEFPKYYIHDVAWTLSFEIYFYILVAVCLFLQRKYFIPSIATIIICGIFFFKPHIPTHPIFFILGGGLLIEFLFGVLIGYAIKTKKYLPVPIAWGILFFSGVLIFIGKTGIFSFPQEFSIGIPISLLIASIVSLEMQRMLRIPRLFSALGDSSYTLYLSHSFSILCVGKTLTIAGLLPLLPADVIIITMVIIATFIGYFAYHTIERPLLLFLNKKRN